MPRQPPRYSGRTAMRANISVHEPKQPVDEESPLAFSMEGLNQSQPGSLLPYVWAPGWNSNQSLHKFQAEVGGPLKGGTAGARLLLSSARDTTATPEALPPKHHAESGKWLLVPRQRIFGSDELSALSPAIAGLVAPASIEISGADASTLQVIEGDGLLIGDGLAALEVRINDSIATGCAAYSTGHAGTFDLNSGDLVTLVKDQHWQRLKPQLIGTDGGGHV